jgi:DNA-directed RNA polymerase subunit RPC12/RpoP
MTIEFNCPKCGALIAFDSRHSGKHAKCLTCGQKFIVPAASFEKPEKVAPEPEPKGDPVPGFYRAVFLDSWKLFVNPQNVTTLAFVIAVICFKFFLAGSCFIQFLAPIVIWGWLFGFYLNLIAETAIDSDTLPEIDVGTMITFVWHVIAPFLVFFSTLFLVELPLFVGLWLARDTGVSLENLGHAVSPLHVILQLLGILGIFLFPSAILATAVGRDFTLLRPDYLFAPIFPAFGPYVTTVLLLIAVWFIQTYTRGYAPGSTLTVAKNLALNLAAQVVAIIAMRSIGLFYRHYACYFKW